MRLVRLLISIACLGVMATSLRAQVRITGYRYAIIGAENDNLGIKEYVEAMLESDGLKVIQNPNSLEPKEKLKVLLFRFRYWDKVTMGIVNPKSCEIGAWDLISNRLIGNPRGSSTWGGMTNAGLAESAVRSAWKQMKYKGFSESDHVANTNELFPARPKVMANIEAFKKSQLTNAIEGIWSFDNNAYQILITKDETGNFGDFVGLVLSSESPAWNKDEVKFEIRSTAAESVFTGNFYRGDKAKIGTTFSLKGSALEWQFDLPDGKRENALMIRNWPRTVNSQGPSNNTGSVGTSFLIGLDGFLATNFHVIDSGGPIKVFFPEAKKEYEAIVVLQDRKNDLAILQIKAFNPYDLGITKLPYRLVSSAESKIGDRVYTVGFPLGPELGNTVKYTEGSLSSKNGMQDDPTYLQISTPIQPGNSGGPLLGPGGNLIGVVVASINPDWMKKQFGTIPQNINFAVKADYLLTLIDMLPVAPNRNFAPSTSPDLVAKAVAIVRVGPRQ